MNLSQQPVSRGQHELRCGTTAHRGDNQRNGRCFGQDIQLHAAAAGFMHMPDGVLDEALLLRDFALKQGRYSSGTGASSRLAGGG